MGALAPDEVAVGLELGIMEGSIARMFYLVKQSGLPRPRRPAACPLSSPLHVARRTVCCAPWVLREEPPLLALQMCEPVANEIAVGLG